jgi:transposase
VVAARFSVSESFVRKLRQRSRADHGVEPLPHSGRERMSRDDAEEALAALVAEDPDAILNGLRGVFADAVGISVSEATMCRQLQRTGLTLERRPS